MSDARSDLLSLSYATLAVEGKTARVFGAFGATYFGFYFNYFSFSQSLPAGQGVV